jgi:hypothetical protein
MPGTVWWRNLEGARGGERLNAWNFMVEEWNKKYFVT